MYRRICMQTISVSFSEKAVVIPSQGIELHSPALEPWNAFDWPEARDASGEVFPLDPNSNNHLHPCVCFRH